MRCGLSTRGLNRKLRAVLVTKGRHGTAAAVWQKNADVQRAARLRSCQQVKSGGSHAGLHASKNEECQEKLEPVQNKTHFANGVARVVNSPCTR